MTESVLLNSSHWITIAPLIAFVLIIFFRKYLGMDGAWVGVVAMGYSFFHSLFIALGIFTGSITLPSSGLQSTYFESFITWFSLGNFDFRVGLLIDGMSSMMLVVVTLVSLLVQIYSISYMHGHKRFGRYFAYVNLFTFSMLVLTVANNILQMFIGWELVGVCSYLLIGFDFERDAAAYAGRKAFITTKIADLGMYIGLLIVFNYLGTFNIAILSQNIATVGYPMWVIHSVPILLFIGAMGKSAQFPLHVWLPDAMEGPTPASALIHAATMVAAGVFMVARLFFLFEASPIAMDVVAWTGTITAIFAASMGLVNIDIKRVLAFSTVSQLGFMMAALGCGGYVAGMFHLTTHAMFKALLFLCAGSVIHAVHTNDMWKMGGLLTKMPITALCYLAATLAIVGFPFTAGFFSKEEILYAAYANNGPIFILLTLAALLTSFYMFRTWFLTFTGMPRDKEKFQHAHESPGLMTIPLITLAVPSIFLGLFFAYHKFDNLFKFLHWGPKPEHLGGSIVLTASLFAFAGGLIAAWLIYYVKPHRYEMLGQKFATAHRVLTNRYYLDELYLWFISKVYHPLSRWLSDLDYNLVDQKGVDGVGHTAKGFSVISGWFDFNFVDQIMIDGNGTVLQKIGAFLRRIQSGLAQSYLIWMAIGLVSMLVWVSNTYK